MVRVICTLMACQDCAMLVANGEPSEERPELEREIAAHLALEPLQHIVSGDSDADDEFSWRPCECCGSRLGGSRHQLALLDCRW
jgi:hypothetical protein